MSKSQTSKEKLKSALLKNAVQKIRNSIVYGSKKIKSNNRNSR